MSLLPCPRRIEQARFERLATEIGNWRHSEEIRDYVAALRNRLPGMEPADGTRVRDWCAWAEQHAERSDPVGAPELIAGIDDDRDRLWHPPR